MKSKTCNKNKTQSATLPKIEEAQWLEHSQCSMQIHFATTYPQQNLQDNKNIQYFDQKLKAKTLKTKENDTLKPNQNYLNTKNVQERDFSSKAQHSKATISENMVAVSSFKRTEKKTQNYNNNNKQQNQSEQQNALENSNSIILQDQVHSRMYREFEQKFHHFMQDYHEIKNQLYLRHQKYPISQSRLEQQCQECCDSQDFLPFCSAQQLQESQDDAGNSSNQQDYSHSSNSLQQSSYTLSESVLRQQSDNESSCACYIQEQGQVVNQLSFFKEFAQTERNEKDDSYLQGDYALTCDEDLRESSETIVKVDNLRESSETTVHCEAAPQNEKIERDIYDYDLTSHDDSFEPYQSAGQISDSSEIQADDALKNFYQDFCLFDQDTLQQLADREATYAPDPQYLADKQKHLTWLMRAILLDWMMEVCNEFTLKRETFHIAVNLTDRFLSAMRDLPKIQLQLVGIATLYTAAKIEEIFPPRLEDFVIAADNGYSAEQIKDAELQIIQKLRWLLNPPTLNIWANWFMSQWDIYAEQAQWQRDGQQQCCNIQFKQAHEGSYNCYRTYMQVLDCALLDVHSLQYKPRALVAALLYLVIGLLSQLFTSEQIVKQMPYTSRYLFEKRNTYNVFFSEFLKFSFGYELCELLPTIQYAATFFHLQMCFELPQAAKLNREAVLEGHFEEFLAYQTHNTANLECVRHRVRDPYAVSQHI